LYFFIEDSRCFSSVGYFIDSSIEPPRGRAGMNQNLGIAP
jgi:hypothetical protein